MFPNWLFAVFLVGLSGNVCAAQTASPPEPPAPDLFRKSCATCHGAKGEGNAKLGNTMSPPPRRFADPAGMMELTRERIIASIRDGRPGTAMPAWGTTLSTAQIEALADFIRERLMPSAIGIDHSQGQQIYAKNCSVCHGDRGDTAVWAQSGLTPAPRNFTTDTARKELSKDRMIFSITYGRSETAMPAWNERLTGDEIRAVADYIRAAFMFPDGQVPDQPAQAGQPADPKAHDHAAHFDLKSMQEPMPEKLQADLSWGKQFYEKNCATCHGKDGDGQGPRSSFINPKPRNFRHTASQHKMNRPHLFEIITNGTPRSEMPAWRSVITKQEIANITEYVFATFIQPGIAKELEKTMDHDHHDHAPPSAPPKTADHGDHGDHGDHATTPPADPPPTTSGHAH
ncbi:MAG: c-type cytochrome [Magnetococcales bacterium]|nr:c-type cytochrome [Magnetococcales bacterium]